MIHIYAMQILNKREYEVLSFCLIVLVLFVTFQIYFLPLFGYKTLFISRLMFCDLSLVERLKKEKRRRSYKVRGGGLEAQRLLAAPKAKNETSWINDQSQDPEGPC